jgi:hypothetical protein
MVDRLRAVRQPTRVQHDRSDMAQLIEGATSALLSTQLSAKTLPLRRPAPARVQLARAHELICDRSARRSGTSGDLVGVMARRGWARWAKLLLDRLIDRDHASTYTRGMTTMRFLRVGAQSPASSDSS